MSGPDVPSTGPGTAEAATAAESEHKQPRYIAIWAVLAVLTGIEVAVAFLGLSRSATILALLGLAAWKALLVALYFMHLKYESTALKVIAAVPLLPAALLILIVLLEY